jgi:hypothetical protein
MLPNHVETMEHLLEGADFGHTLLVCMRADGRVELGSALNIEHPRDRANVLNGGISIPLSFAAHTLAAYRRLPHGWRTTPRGRYTDQYMWQQFLAQTEFRFSSNSRPTILYFSRGVHPGLSASERLRELQRHYPKVTSRQESDEFKAEVWNLLVCDRARLAGELWNLRPTDFLKTIRHRIPDSLRAWIRRVVGIARH